jgi:DNA helicase-2/ATP-dependent DNA helicase PcrA
MMSGPTPQQLTVVESSAPMIACEATAGSGKTSTLVARVKHLAERGERCLVMAFNKAAADTLTFRLQGCDADIRTLHSAAWMIACSEAPLVGVGGRGGEVEQRVYDDLLKEVVRNAAPPTEISRREWKELRDAIKRLAAATVANDYVSVRTYLEETGTHGVDRHIIAAQRLIDHMLAKRRTGFNSLDLGFLYAAQAVENGICPGRLSDIRHICVDEAQDLSAIQWRMIDALVKHLEAHLIVVGDGDQCQPVTERITLAGGSIAQLGELHDGDHVASYSFRTGKFIGRSPAGGRAVRVADRFYSGPLHCFDIDGTELRVTPEHRCMVRIPKGVKDNPSWVTYLMRRQLGDREDYRVGWCQLFRSDGNFHPVVRMRLEEADCLWIIGHHMTKVAASLDEAVVSVRYGVPTLPFVPCFKKGTPSADRHKMLYSEGVLNSFWEGLGGDYPGIAGLLHDRGLLGEHPLVIHRGIAGHKKIGRPAPVVAANVLPGVMEMARLNPETETISWHPVTRTIHHFEGTVRSLDVAGTELYFANGILTHNCIYRWRFSSLTSFLGRCRDYTLLPLTVNFRCPADVVESSAKLIANNKNRVAKDIVPHREDRCGIVVHPIPDAAAEAAYVAERIQALVRDGTPFRDFAVMSRTHSARAEVEKELLRRRVPFQVLGSSTWKRAEIDRLMDFLLVLLKGTVGALARVAEELPGIGAQTISSALMGVRELEVGLTSLARFARTTKAQTSVEMLTTAIEDGRRALRAPSQHSKENYAAASLVGAALLYPSAGISDDDGDAGGAESSQQVCEAFACLAKGVADWDELSGYLQSLRDPKEAAGSSGLVTLSTVHRMKGQEYPHVFVIGVVEGLFPHRRAREVQDQEDERKLAFVAFTRALQSLTITVPGQDIGGRESAPSRFIRECGLALPGGADGGEAGERPLDGVVPGPAGSPDGGRGGGAGAAGG